MSVKIGIALGAGGARGLAHLGVLKVLEDEGIPVHCLAGSSIGAVVSAMYAQNPDADFITERIRQAIDESFYDELRLNSLKKNCAKNGSIFHQVAQNIKNRIIINIAQSREALLKEVRLRNVISKFIEAGNIEDTKIPLGIVATSLHTGEYTLIRTGDIIAAVTASSSIPCFFSPMFWNGDLLTDGAVSCPVPVQFLSQMGVDITIGVEVCMREYSPLEVVNVIEIIDRINLITSRNLSRMMANAADVAICPDTKDISWSDFSRLDELVQAGMDSAKEKIPEINKAIQRKLPWYKRLIRQ